jgi:hypothetical protein
MSIVVYFDFTCRFANRMHLWLRDADVDVRWRPFSLLEANRDDDGRPVWERGEYADNISLLMLAGHELVQDAGGEADRYRARVFAAWHGRDERLDAGSVLRSMAAAGVDADWSALAAGRRLLGDRHDDAVARGVFGSPTIVFASGRGSFVRFRAVPSRADAPVVLDALRTLADDAPELSHLEPLRH